MNDTKERLAGNAGHVANFTSGVHGAEHNFVLDPSAPSGLAYRYDSQIISSTCKVTGKTTSQRAGDPAGGVDDEGYWVVYASSKYLLAHHVVWLLTHRKWPTTQLDHIDGNTLNNNIDNLREVPCKSIKVEQDGTTRYGVIGVRWDPLSKYWCAGWLEADGSYVEKKYYPPMYGPDKSMRMALTAYRRAVAALR